MTAALAGARSVHAIGWMADECASAALERIARRPPANDREAFYTGRTAAIDELRKLTGHRRAPPVRAEREHPPDGYALVDSTATVDAFARRLTHEQRQVVTMLARGVAKEQIAKACGITPSAVSHRITAVRNRADRALLEDGR